MHVPFLEQMIERPVMSLFPTRKAESFDFKEVQYEKGDWVASCPVRRI